MLRQSPLGSSPEISGELICSKICKFPKSGGYYPAGIFSFIIQFKLE